MKDTLTYKKLVTDPNIDDTVATSSYSINDTLLANTSYQYDTFKRISNHIINFNSKSLKKVYTYNRDKLNEVKTYVSNNLKSTDEYSYDSLNRISSVTSGNKTISYEYDTYGRLKRENNGLLDKTIIYDYNDICNIVTNNTYQYTVAASPSTLLSSKSYTYDSTNKDRLINFNGTDISYNTLGCPTTLNGYNLTWNNGKLTKYAKGNTIIGQESNTYSYNAYGQRVSKAFSKTAGRNGLNPLIKGEIASYDKIYNYDHNGRLINEICEVTLHEDGTYKESIDYIYDVNTIIGMRYIKNNVTSTYYFDRNVFGDVVGIYDTNGDLKVKYLYDAYGNCTISNETTDQGLAILNPIRYRGYYYDVETGWFWLSSRYYSPELCRWISPDDIEYLDPESVNGLNLYCYASNNPVGRVKSLNIANVGMLSGLGMNTMLSMFKLPVVNSNAGSSNYWNLHWKNKWFDTDWPGLFEVSNSAVELINWGLTIYKGSLYFDNDEQHSIYNASLNLSVYAGFNFEKKKYGVELGGSVGRLGYDGRFIDVQVDFLTAKFFFIYEDGKLKIDPGFGWVDFGISIDIAAIIEYLKGNG